MNIEIVLTALIERLEELHSLENSRREKEKVEKDVRDTTHKRILKMLAGSPVEELQRILAYMRRDKSAKPAGDAFFLLEKEFVLDELRKHQQSIFELDRENQGLLQRIAQLEANQWQWNRPWPVYVGTETPSVPTFGNTCTTGIGKITTCTDKVSTTNTTGSATCITTNKVSTT